jgi:hypothetical protein
LGVDPPDDMRIDVPAGVGSNFEAIVAPLDGHWWKLVRTFDDPATWTEPFVRHLASTGGDRPTYRTEALLDEWEMYDLTSDPAEATNLWPDDSIVPTRDHLVGILAIERARCSPPRNEPWPYIRRLIPAETSAT